MTDKAFVKIGNNKGKPRIWFEGARLANAGIHPGEHYTVTYDADNAQIIIELAEDGKRKVSRKKKGERVLPVIDLHAVEIAEVFGNVERVCATIEERRIVIDIHPDDQAARGRLR